MSSTSVSSCSLDEIAVNRTRRRSNRYTRATTTKGNLPRDGGPIVRTRWSRRGSVVCVPFRHWREYIIKCASDAIDQAAKLGEYGSWLFTVDVEFFLPRQTKNDIDNLAKPVIDTLFSPGVPNGNQDTGVTGKVFPLAD